MSIKNLRILIISEHASLKFGGEAALPLHYFRVLRKRGIEAWLIVHERTKNELKTFFPEDCERIYFIKDTFWHILVWRLGQLLPRRLSYFTFGLILRLMTQLSQRQLAQNLIQEKQIDIIHQPIPVSPKEPSSLYELGVPVVIGPMNGGMNYPSGFDYMESKWVKQSVSIGRAFADFMNSLIPGKLKATTLLVANSRTQAALPTILQDKTIIELVENGVDLSIWQSFPKNEHPLQDVKQTTKFVYVGRLIELKGVDILLLVVKQISDKVTIKLDIIGDGIERANLEQKARNLGLISDQNASDSSKVRFLGWLSQSDCAKQLQVADVLILPSLHECGGAVVLEAMAMGIPVIATNWGGPADYIDESCGILVEPSSRQAFIDGLASAIVKLANNPELCQKMGEAGYEKIQQQFDWERKVDRILEIYQDSIERYFKETKLKQNEG
ncbi:MAG: glycosyltransferase family 4 protein [Moorea sp. SIO2B7]|nr:glycosyltransferase family 4 protein [Moorena sp. SIO2B7]